MKWFIAVAGAVLIGWFAWFQLNTTKISYVNGLAPYNVMPGRDYILEHDCYVFVWRESPTSGFPLLGVNHPDVLSRTSGLPRESARTNLGRKFPEVRILDLIPQGTRLRLTSVRREQSRRAGVVISYEAKFLDEVDRPYPKVDLRPILLPAAQPGDVPEIDTTIAVPWLKR